MRDRPDSAHAGPPHRQHCRHKGTRSERKPHWRPGGTCQFPEWVTIVDWAGRGGERIPAAHYLALFVPYDRQNKAKTMKRESFFRQMLSSTRETRQMRKEPWLARALRPGETESSARSCGHSPEPYHG